MRTVFLLVLSFLLGQSIIIAQDLYMPRNIQTAYKNGTRSITGAPGSKYWQNKGNYNINITVDVVNKSIIGKEHIVYFNNSPDALQQIVIRFVNNMRKPESPRSWQVSKDFLNPGLKIISFIIDGTIYNINSDNWATVNDIKLNNPLPARAKAEVDIEWSYPLSKVSGREGQIDPQTFFCAYAYPRISVYDDYNGWDHLPHTGGQEFYNDFNDYTVAIKVPTNYVVWATGTLDNAKDVLNSTIYKRFKESLTSNKVINVATRKEMEQGAVTNEATTNTWLFKAYNITDFTFATSNHYVWDAGSAVVANNRAVKRISVQAAYNDTAADFKKYIEWEKYCIQWYSNNVPGVAYPYPSMTAFQGYADMEYPMMVNDASVSNMKEARMIADHEIAHTYFPFYMGINETRYAYMDEGWATTLEYLIGLDENNKAYTDSVYKDFRVKSWINTYSTEMDQPLISMSSQLSGAGYGRNSYVKASLSYLALRDLLGHDVFIKGLHQYMNNWNGRHPMPWDFFYSFNTATRKDLNWFWNNWFFSNYYIDLKISNLEKTNDSTLLSIENTGGFAIPFDIILQLGNGKEKIIHFTPEVWKKNPKKATIPLIEKETINSLKIDGGIFMDAKPEDNTYTT